MFENHRKSLIQYCERSELRLHFKWSKVAKNGPFCRVFKNLQLAVRKVLPDTDRSILIRQKLVEILKTQM